MKKISKKSRTWIFFSNSIQLDKLLLFFFQNVKKNKKKIIIDDLDFFFIFNSIRRIIIFLIFFPKSEKKNFKKITIEDVLEMEAAGPIGNFNDMGVNFEVVALELMLPDPLNPE